MRGHTLFEVGLAELEQRRVPVRDNVGRACLAREQDHLAKEATFFGEGQHALLAAGIGAYHLHSAVEDRIHSVAGVALAEDALSVTDATLLEPPGNPG